MGIILGLVYFKSTKIQVKGIVEAFTATFCKRYISCISATSSISERTSTEKKQKGEH
jgi:hypothetical protein